MKQEKLQPCKLSSIIDNHEPNGLKAATNIKPIWKADTVYARLQDRDEYHKSAFFHQNTK